MAQSKEFVDASHALNDLSHALALLESENASLRGAVDGLCNENAKLRELVRYMWDFSCVLPDEPYTSKEELAYSVEVWKRMRELGIEIDDGVS